MAWSPKVYCIYPGCSVLIAPKQTYCELHKKYIIKNDKEKVQDLNKQVNSKGSYKA